MKYFLKTNVLDATKKRIRFIFKEFDDVIVWVSAGKDSTVIFNLTLEIARELNRLPLKVAFIDQESEWSFTIELMRKWMYREDVTPLWYQIPFRLSNSLSKDHEFLNCWNEDERELWPREKEEIAITENHYGTDRFHYLFEAILTKDFPDGRIGCISGVRTEESPSRHNGLTSSATYKWITWGKKYNSNNHINFHPIYDWSFTDIWKAIHEHRWEYNKIYDYQHRYGINIKSMRVSSLHHETAIRSLFYMQEVDPKSYSNMILRMPGINTAAHLGADNQFYIKELPFMFTSWKDYRDFLLDKLIQPKNRKVFDCWFKSQDIEFGEMPESTKKELLELGIHNNYEGMIRTQVNAIICNDIDGTKLENLQKRNSTKISRKWRKERQAENEFKK